jgi:hypothetical protein
MSNMATQKLFALARRNADAVTRLRMKEKAAVSGTIERAGETLAVLMGSGIAGAIDGKWGYDDPTNEHHGIAKLGPMPINTAIGLVAVAIGIPGFLPGSEYLTSGGAAMIGYTLGKTVEGKLQEKAA